jgi:hypothetical protein
MRRRVASSLVIPPLSRMSVWGEVPYHLLHGGAGGFDAFDGGGQAFLAEQFPAGGVFFDEAVGVGQDPVTAPEPSVVDQGRRAAEADGQRAGAFQRADDPVVADQQGCGVAGFDPSSRGLPLFDDGLRQ